MKTVSTPLGIIFILAFLVGCSPISTNQITKDSLPTMTPVAVSTGSIAVPTPEATATSAEVTVTEINPLTGQAVPDVDQLKRRPILVKVQNAPREDRPQFGLTAADVVFEYSIEFGDTRFAAIYYSQFPDKVGPIRSARHIDIHLVKGYKAILVFGGAYEDLLDLLADSDFGDRLVREGPNTKPAMFRYDPEGHNYLLADLTLMDPVLETYNIDNYPQKLEGMLFSENIPDGGDPAGELSIRFSAASYNTWKYDSTSRHYLRFSETKNDLENNDPQVAPLMDHNNEEQIAADNVVIIQAMYDSLIKTSSTEVYDIQLLGEGEAYLARDGKIIPLKWQRKAEEDVVSLVDQQGRPFPFKPGKTWFQVLSTRSRIEHQGENWSFINWLP